MNHPTAMYTKDLSHPQLLSDMDYRVFTARVDCPRNGEFWFVDFACKNRDDAMSVVKQWNADNLHYTYTLLNQYVIPKEA